jgi:catechol 2,3-dioxygenase-like lactoylglutathione lyase family enzyme
MSTRILILFIASLGNVLLAGNLQSKEQGSMTTMRVRYMVNDLDPAIEFYTRHLGFSVKQEKRPNFAMLSRGNLELVLSTPFGPGGAAKPMLDGRKPVPGGWNRIIINVSDLPAEVARLRQAQLHFRNDIVAGPGGSEILLDDPSGNPVELFQPASQSQTEPHTRRANAKITVQNSEAKPYDQGTSPALVEIHLTETFTGDIDGESPVRALQVLRDDKSGSLVSVQRFRGKVGGRQGTFVLQGSEIVQNGKIKATWSVVPGSGTGDLAGLRGDGGFEGDFGKGSEGWLDYWFE